MGPIRGEISQQIVVAPSVSGAVLWFDPPKLAWNNRAGPTARALHSTSVYSLSVLYLQYSMSLANFFFLHFFQSVVFVFSSPSFVPFFFNHLICLSLFPIVTFLISSPHLPSSFPLSLFLSLSLLPDTHPHTPSWIISSFVEGEIVERSHFIDLRSSGQSQLKKEKKHTMSQCVFRWER